MQSEYEENYLSAFLLSRFHASQETFGENSLSQTEYHNLHLSSPQALVYDYDHVCPWTGTAIGKGNMIPFKIFVFSVNVLCYFSVGLVIWQVLDNVT